MTVIHQTERLHLRPFAPRDATAVVEHLNDMETCQGLALVPCPYTLEDAHAFIGQAFPEALAVCLQNDTLIGAMGLGKQLGYWFGKPYWGNGYATEAARPVLKAHFENSDTDIISGYLTENYASAAVLRKLGFRVTGDKMLHIRSRDQSFPAKSVTLTQQDWEASR